jgi:cyclophilin family peptidyl-prolyl cis-trans isomerase
VTNATVILSGTAEDDRNVARVIYFLGDTSPRVAAGTTNWSVSLNLNPGTNVVRAQSIDAFGNLSVAVEQRIIYFVPLNTLMRFHIFTGEGAVGDVDVELFDREKPETVRNFLRYVRNGSYNQVLLHRLVAGFLLQGGGFTNAAATDSTNLFSQFGRINNLGFITNESAVGLRISNSVGTLAMAKSGTDPNSASDQWFFNLGNNSAALDFQNGGFTVFGRVLPDTDAMGGTNLLLTFNAKSHGNGIVNMTNFFGSIFAAFTNLPVNYSGFTAPQSRQVFYVSVTELNGPAEADTNAPTVTVTSPEQDSVVTNATVILSGTAADDRGLARVLYFFGDASARVATGTTNWSAQLLLNPGTNVVRVQSVDAFGNLSAEVEQRIIYYVPPNPVVRFQIFTGEGAVGAVDVELFEREKPATVRNFLRYVRNGSYQQVLLHRLVAGFVLQGGGFTNADAADSTNIFSQYGKLYNLGPVTNEFAVGARLSNSVGTLAMAKIVGDPNSASDQWFFNLGNNAATLDAQNGGFTVFGRVLPDTNAMAGTNLLFTFNGRSAGNGIINMATFFGASWLAFTNLPVNYNGFTVPRCRQLFYVSVSELNGPERDTNAPTVAVTSPGQDALVTNATVTLSGTAADDIGVARVIYFIGDATVRVAAGTVNWSAQLTLTPGTNVVRVQSVDAFGNLSPLVERRINYFVPPNSLVRFQIFTGAGPVGTVDVELFSREKPETVANFLRYVRNGSYQQVLLHRLVPGFVLQGGGFTNADAADGTNLFAQFGEIQNLGAITNEFGVGMRLSNTVGTLAMAKVGSDPNSASAQWFFNLGNNSANLDAQNGGFTVFGRVLPDTSPAAGTNLLLSFSARSVSNGIINMASLAGPSWSAFTDLPVNYSGFTVPQSRELFYASVGELNGPTEADTNAPAVTVTSPVEDAIVTNATVTLTGTAEDDRAVARVIYFFGTTAPRVAAGKTNWSAPLVLSSGTNVVRVQGIDAFGNVSPPVKRTFRYFVPSRITLQVVGPGQVTGLTNGQVLTVGEVYTVTAQAAGGAFFGGWSGGAASAKPTLTFRMQTNLTLTATFKPNPFPQGRGRYEGLFVATNRPAPESSGTLDISIKASGAHAGGMTYQGSRFIFHGAFDRTGQELLQGVVLGQSVNISMGLDTTGSAIRVTGPVFIGGTVAQLDAYRTGRPSLADTQAQVGNYTFLISGAANAATNPGGQGFGTMKLGPSGKISLAGTLGEGTAFKQKATLLGGNRWRFFSPLYREGGSILGWAQFETNRAGSFSGPLYWFEPMDLTNHYYGSGFTNTVLLRGSRYVPPGAGERVLNWTNGTMVLQGGNLPAPLTVRVALGLDHTFMTFGSPIPLMLAVDPKTGQVSGHFQHPVTLVDTPLQGMVVQGFGVGGGLYYGTSQTGSFLIQKE